MAPNSTKAQAEETYSNGCSTSRLGFAICFPAQGLNHGSAFSNATPQTFSQSLDSSPRRVRKTTSVIGPE